MSECDLTQITKLAIVGNLLKIFPNCRVVQVGAISWKDDGDNTVLIDGEKKDLLCFMYVKDIGCLVAVDDEKQK